MKSTVQGLAFAATLLAASNAQADVFQEFPRTGSATLSNGATVPLPFYLFDYENVALMGTANLGVLNTELQGQGVTPLLEAGLGLVALYAIHYRSTDFGAYDEGIIAVAVQPKDPLSPRLTFYVHRISVTQQLPLLAGIELLGLPKLLHSLSYSTANHDMVFDWKNASSTSMMAMSCHGCDALPTAPARIDFDVASPLNASGQRVWSRIVSDTGTINKPYATAAGDSFSYNAQTDVGGVLSRIGFTPTSWLIGRQIRAVDIIYP